jgi:uncharacterized protein involved in type VI secretion and phage assembly
MCGVYYGVVTQNKDADKGLARVKVKLPWLDNGDQDQAQWAQLSTPMAGDKFGFYCLPDVGDVVAVMFIAGDINHPVVLGGIWSKVDKAPEENGSGKNDFRGYRSRAGSRIVLDDSSNGKVMFADKTNKNVVCVGSFSKGGDGDNASAPPKPAGGGSSGVLTAAVDGKLNVTCKNGKLKVSAIQIKVTGKSGVEMKAGGDLSFEGAMTQINASGNFNADGSSAKIGP